MSESIPLSAALRIQTPQVIIYDILRHGFDLMLEAFASKGRDLRMI